MKAKLVVDGKEFPIEIQDSELQKIFTQKTDTGYERVDETSMYYFQDCNGNIAFEYDRHNAFNIVCYNVANYYSNETIAKNNAKADKLMRKLRRFAVEHRKGKMSWANEGTRKYYICTKYGTNEIVYDYACVNQSFSTIYFDTEEAVELAIHTFYDELVWYFTEYKDSL